MTVWFLLCLTAFFIVFLFIQELDLLREDANVYKLIGPVLVKQDLAEANANVRKRIEYISAEL
jgi:prefoldin beta subunit